MGRGRAFLSYHEEGPDGVVEEDDGGGHKHGETDELVELGSRVSFASSWTVCCEKVDQDQMVAVSLEKQQGNKTKLGRE